MTERKQKQPRWGGGELLRYVLHDGQISDCRSSRGRSHNSVGPRYLSSRSSPVARSRFAVVVTHCDATRAGCCGGTLPHYNKSYTTYARERSRSHTRTTTDILAATRIFANRWRARAPPAATVSRVRRPGPRQSRTHGTRHATVSRTRKRSRVCPRLRLSARRATAEPGPAARPPALSAAARAPSTAT